MWNQRHDVLVVERALSEERRKWMESVGHISGCVVSGTAVPVQYCNCGYTRLIQTEETSASDSREGEGINAND